MYRICTYALSYHLSGITNTTVDLTQQGNTYYSTEMMVYNCDNCDSI